jgi:TRAP-type C4-dicarboxylate transport system permease small subunit
MKRLDKIVEGVCEWAALVAGGLLILAAIYVSAELVSRRLLGVALVGSNEISGYVLAVATAWAFAYAMLKRSHIRIDVFYRLLPPRGRAAVDILAALSLTVFAAIFVWYAHRYFGQVWTRGTRSITSLAVQLWIPMLGWYLGWIVFLAVCLYLTLTSILAFVRGDLGEVQARIGSVSEDEEIELAHGPETRPGGRGERG